MKELSIQALKARLSAAVADAASGHTIVITRHGEPMARLAPAGPPAVHRGRHVAAGRLKPVLRRGTKGRYLSVLTEDRADR